jgi:2-oxo-3-hexenedioate decarboxylase
MYLKEIVENLDRAVVQAQPVNQISQYNQVSLDDAYEIQKLTIDRRYGRGEKLIGIKLGFASEAKMKQMGVSDMIWHRLTDQMLIEDGGVIELKKSIHPRAEPEVCFRISTDIEGEIALEDLDQ